MSVEVNRPGFVFHCEQPGCSVPDGLRLVGLVVRVGVRRYEWRCPLHQGGRR